MISFKKSANSHVTINGDYRWSILEKLYDNNYPNNEKIPEKIPKIFHQVWLGSEYPKKYEKLKQTFIDNNPDWEFKIWTDKDVNKFDLVNKKIFDKCKNMGSKSDIFRYEILYKFGGVYIDTDFICLKPFNDLLYLDFFSGNGQVSEPEIFNGLIGTTPKNRLIKKVIDSISEINENNFESIMKSTGPYLFQKVFFENIDYSEKVLILPETYFYSLPAVDRFKIREENDLEKIKKYAREESYTIHLWYTSWQR